MAVNIRPQRAEARRNRGTLLVSSLPTTSRHSGPSGPVISWLRHSMPNVAERAR